MEERFVLDNNNNIIDFEDETDKYCLSQDDVCNLLNKQHQRIAELEQELAGLKENAIVPRFRIGQEVFVVDNECQITQGAVDVILTGQDVFEKWCKYSIDLGLEYEDDIRFVYKDEEEIFATEQEAQEKIKEIQGNE